MNKSARIGCGLSTGLILVLAGLTAFGIYRFQHERNETAALRAADSAVSQRDFDGAIALFDRALQLHLPTARAAVAYYGRGYANSQKFKYDEAVRDFSETIRLDSRKVDAYWGRGFAYQQKGELDKAVADYAEALQRNPNLGHVYFNRGLIYLARKEWAQAALDFSEAIRCEPGDASAFLNRGMALLEAGDLGGALVSLDASISINPLAEAYKVRAVIHKRRGDEALARDDGAKALELASAKTAAAPVASDVPSTLPGADLLRRARTAAAAGNHDEAIELCNQALGLTLGPSLASDIFMIRGIAYATKKDWDQALHDYDEAIKIDPKNADALVNRGNAYAHKNQGDKALQDYDEAIHLRPNLEEAYYNRALEYLFMKKVDKGLADLNEAIRINPKSAASYRWRVVALLEFKRADAALADAETVVTLRPELGDAYYCRARVYLWRRDYAKAAADLERTLKLGREPQNIHLNALAWLYATCPEKAVRDGKRAVELATKGCEFTNWKNVHVVDTLAAAFAEAGNFNEAVKWQTYALDSFESPEEIRSGMRQRLKSYQKHRPYRADKSHES